MTTKKALVYSLVFLVAAARLSDASMAQDVPAKLNPPVGVTMIGAYIAKGVQIYTCTTHGTAAKWSFKAPDAQLFDAKGAIFAKHYAGPTWEAVDGSSKAIGKMIETVPAPTAGAIPWLLLSAKASGRGIFAGTRFIQRIKTAGGVVAGSVCSEPGAEQRVAYSAQYVFYK